MAELVLVRYGELALKSPPVRREFESRLRRNLLDQFVAEGVAARVRADRGHFYVEADDGAQALRIVRRVFGVTSASRVVEVASEPAAIRERLLQLADPWLRAGASFAVRVRRTGSHPFTSQELARDLGADVLARFADRSLTVDLDHPEVELHVEVRGPRTYLSFDRVRGPGGLPLGVAGHVVALVDGPRGALGAFLLMKRGCQCALVVLPSGEPFGTVLSRFDPHARIVHASGEPTVWEAALEETAGVAAADAVVLPIDVDDYATARSRWADRVVFSPTIGFSPEEVDAQWRTIAELAE